MGMFDKLKGAAQKYTKEHPDKVDKAEQTVKEKLGVAPEAGADGQPEPGQAPQGAAPGGDGQPGAGPAGGQ
jgi:hypothetical protein